MAVLKRYEKEQKRFFIRKLVDIIINFLSKYLMLIIPLLFFFLLYQLITVSSAIEICMNYAAMFVILLWSLLNITKYFCHGYRKIFKNFVNRFIKHIDNKYKKGNKTLVIIGRDDKANVQRSFSPSVQKEIFNLLAYLNFRWGSEEYSILYTKSPVDIIKAIQEKTVKNIYFYGHGSRGYFDNYKAFFDYDLLQLVEDKKNMVVQLTCCGDDDTGCAADYLLEGENKKKYQAGTTINRIDTDLNNFFYKDLVENNIFETEEIAKMEIKKEAKKNKTQ